MMYFFKINCIIVGVNPIHGDPRGGGGGKTPPFDQKMTTNTGIIQRTSLFGPFDNAKQPQFGLQILVLSK